ncbi:MAG TPA: hypothetical protein ENH14_00455 [candidate division WOR-3 bacterium]|uniref:Glycoside hydrolase family 42 N-terminal domain-containing protein n=1 Tax=candidate division WOR-3 bacterium TaxID=2052148 RepID=A0A7V0Q632_UNCW3|nr:hypothetical protein [candidate division WOR-3 bacterium]
MEEGRFLFRPRVSHQKMIKMKEVKIILALLIVGIILSRVYYITIPPRVKVEAPVSLTTPEMSYVMPVNEIPKLFVGDKETEITGFYTSSLPIAGSQESIENIKKYINKTAEYNLTFVIVGISGTYIDKSLNISAPVDIQEQLIKLFEEGRYKEFIELLEPMDSPEDAAELIDWALLDELFDYAASKGVYLVPSYIYNLPPLWWIKNYETHLQRSNTGNISFITAFNSPYNEKYADQVITAMVKRYKNHPALLGWDLYIGASGENNYPGGGYTNDLGWYDYSEVAQQRFKEWLKEEYGENLSVLRAAWGNSSVTFENAEMPKPLPDISDRDEMVDWINEPGDRRREFYDWQLFRLEEKDLARNHIAKLYKDLDPNHVVFSIASAPPINSGVFLREMAVDYYNYASSPYIDVVFACPGVYNGYWDEPARVVDTSRSVRYFQNRGKAVFIKWEDWGCTDLEEIKKCVVFARRTSSGLVIWEGKNIIPGDVDIYIYEFTDKEITTFASTLHSTSETSEESVKKADFVIIEDPFLDTLDYRWGIGEFEKFSGYKIRDRLVFGTLLSSARLDYDIISRDEIEKNPEILSKYKAVALVNLGRMDEKFLDALLDYRASGGGLFIVGRTGLFDEYGEKNRTYLKKLLNISEIQEYKITQYSWSFSNDDKLLEGIEGEEMNVKRGNLVYIPTFDYEKYGYKILARLDAKNNPEVATVGYKGRTVFWFPRIGVIEEEENIQKFLLNLYEIFVKGT